MEAEPVARGHRGWRGAGGSTVVALRPCGPSRARILHYAARVIWLRLPALGEAPQRRYGCVLSFSFLVAIRCGDVERSAS